ncbi:helix-turn-helix domain-containing protein [Edwardsiella piscicida]|uniref:helix-turn-helix domain-containing protein n=1 Tax=Edwardsiella piscicida TaxID=1263550 RepID=UPI00290AAED4|nr:helix-turn-helix domain-containing protein [Edwardsiella piscicida]
MMYDDAVKAAKVLASIVPLLGGSQDRTDYESALSLIEHLLETDPDSPLVDMLSAKIDAYENSAPEFAEFNYRLAGENTGIAVLQMLMKNHGMAQSDLQDEIGSKALVSRILSGQRNLTLEHMRKLAHRFNVPVTAFIDTQVQ